MQDSDSRIGDRKQEVSMAIGLESDAGAITIDEARLFRGATPARLYELAIAHEGAAILSSGALATFSGEKTGRSPKDKRIVEDPGELGRRLVGIGQHPGAATQSFLDCRRRATRVPRGAADGLRRRRLRRLGPGLPAQGPRHLLPGLPRPVHAQPADPADARGARSVRRARLRHLQRRRPGRRSAASPASPRRPASCSTSSVARWSSSAPTTPAR